MRTTFGALLEEGRIHETEIGYRTADLRHKWAIRIGELVTYVDTDDDGTERTYRMMEHWYLSDRDHPFHGPVLVESCLDDHALIFSKREAGRYLLEHPDLITEGYEIVEMYEVLR